MRTAGRGDRLDHARAQRGEVARPVTVPAAAAVGAPRRLGQPAGDQRRRKAHAGARPARQGEAAQQVEAGAGEGGGHLREQVERAGPAVHVGVAVAVAGAGGGQAVVEQCLERAGAQRPTAAPQHEADGESGQHREQGPHREAGGLGHLGGDHGGAAGEPVGERPGGHLAHQSRAGPQREQAGDGRGGQARVHEQQRVQAVDRNDVRNEGEHVRRAGQRTWITL
jgi:hypothetical protein